MSNIRPKDSSGISFQFSLAIVGLIFAAVGTTTFLTWSWLGSLAATTELVEGRNQLLWQGLCVAVFFSGAAYLISKQLTKPLRNLSASVQVAGGDSGSRVVPETNRSDEVGTVARHIRDLNSSLACELETEDELAQSIETVQHALDRLRDGTFLHRISGELPTDIAPLKASYNAAMDALQASVGTVADRTAQIKGNADEISRAVQQLSKRTESQAATLEQSSAAIEELAQGVVSTAEGAKQADLLAGSTRSDAEASGMVMDQAVSAMQNIESSSSQITHVVSVIDDIAFQTNLLALNASVEAARAGDAGRGFAVVAAEVRALAQRSSEAAKQIETLMSESHNHVSQGVEHVQNAVDTLRNIASSVTEISSAVSAIATTAQEQSLGVAEINSAISSLDIATQETATMVATSATAGAQLKDQAAELEQVVSRFGGLPRAVGAGFAPLAAPNPVAEQQAKLARYVSSDGSAARVSDDDSEWVEF